MNLLVFNFALSLQSVYLCLKKKFYFVLYTALVYTNALYIQYFKIIIVAISTDIFFVANFTSNGRNVQCL